MSAALLIGAERNLRGDYPRVRTSISGPRVLLPVKAKRMSASNATTFYRCRAIVPLGYITCGRFPSDARG